RVITRRIAHLVATGVPPHAILAITFTNKAADEMKHRVETITGMKSRWISTFHAFGSRILREFGAALGYPRELSIYDTDDTLGTLRDILKDFDIPAETLKPAAAAQAISQAKTAFVLPAQFAERAASHPDRLIARLYARYEEVLAARKALDFDDLLMKLLILFDKDPEALRACQTRFRYILVDEYQDTNRPQYLIAQRLAEAHRNLCVTGDPDQSIYGWRGADLGNILDFTKDYPETKVVKLERNYRSTAKILAAAQRLIENNAGRLEKTLFTENETGAPVEVLRCQDARHESRVIAERVAGFLSAGIPPSGIAVFYRTNAQSRSLEEGLRDSGIPYRIIGGTEFYHRREIKDLLAYLRCLVNPADDLAMERIINVPTRGIGKTSVEALKRHAAATGIPLRAAIPQVRRVEGLKSSAVKAAAALDNLLVKLGVGRDKGPSLLLKQILQETEFEKYLKEFGDAAAEDRVENVRELVRACEEFERQNPEAGIEGFLDVVTLVSDADKLDPDAPAVSLMTLHTSKGLEFPAVFVTGLEEGLLPHSRSVNSDVEIEEERRLLFVGMTRAKQHLALTFAVTRDRFGGGGFRNPESRFLRELPREELDLQDLADPFPGLDTPASQPPEIHRDSLALDDVEDENAYRVGDLVRHDIYGFGRILTVEGFGARAKVRIRFRGHGEKRLVTGFAPMRKCEADETAS
ncbi:MAG: 3'-5' exonuclease, partial [Planctomycetota bacterium]